jgi:Golgi nucleoside diphosphatase
MYDVRLLCMIYSIYRHDRSSKNQEPYLCDQNRTDSAQKIYQLIAGRRNAGFVVQETVVYLENQESSYATNTVEFTVYYCNLYLCI